MECITLTMKLEWKGMMYVIPFNNLFICVVIIVLVEICLLYDVSMQDWWIFWSGVVISSLIIILVIYYFVS